MAETKQKRRSGKNKSSGQMGKVWATEDAIRQKRRRLRDLRDIASLFWKICMIVVFLVVFFCTLFGIHTVSGEDMKPRLSDGDLVLYFRLEPVYEVREVVVYESGGRIRVGRIIAQPEDEVEIAGGGVTINGYLTAEDGIYYGTPDYDERVTYPVSLGADEFFILADYREGARDSRFYGPINKRDIKGKVITVIRSHSF